LCPILLCVLCAGSIEFAEISVVKFKPSFFRRLAMAPFQLDFFAPGMFLLLEEAVEKVGVFRREIEPGGRLFDQNV
jgi:hypothetical protein